MKTTKTRPAGTRGYAYIRVSKDVQDARSQRQAIEKWLAARGVGVVDWIEDSGSRDLSYKRPGFQRLIHELVEKGQADFIVVAERDRFGVADNEEWGYYVTILRRHNCRLWAVADDKELTSRADRVEPFMAAITADRSRSEQEARGQREHRSKLALVGRGHWPGGKAPWGYDLVCYEEATGRWLWRIVYEPGKHKRVAHYPDGTSRRFDGRGNFPVRNKGEILIPEKTQDPVLLGWVEKVFRWFAEGYSFRAIASQLNRLQVPPLYKSHWVGPTARGVLSNPIYATGTPVWNKAAHGRFVEYVGGEWVPVERDGGRVKAGRKRTSKDHVTAPPKPENAIIDAATWNKVQARIRALEAAPKAERRPRNPDLYLSGLVVCADCGEPMVAWAQQNSYRCSRNMHDSRLCRCNRTRHDTLEELLALWLEQTNRSLELLAETPDDCLRELDGRSEPLIREYVRRIGGLWRRARDEGREPPAETADDAKVWTHRKLMALYGPAAGRPAEDLRGRVEAKEREKERLVRRLGLVDDDESAAAVAARIAEVTKELRDLRGQARPAADRDEALRDQIRGLLDQARRARDEAATAVPLRKGEYIRGLVSQVRVTHRERKMGRLRASRLVGVEIIPALGQAKTYRDGKDFDADARDEGVDWDGRPYGSPEQWRRCKNVVDAPAPFREESSPGPS